MGEDAANREYDMSWYAASVIMYVQFKDGRQDKYPIWENILLVDATTPDEALSKAEGYGKEGEGDSDGSLSWEKRPAEWVYGGIRKLIEISNPTDILNKPGDGAEVTYSEFEVKDKDSLAKLIGGKSVIVHYIE
jgi:hypothetical protein